MPLLPSFCPACVRVRLLHFVRVAARARSIPAILLLLDGASSVKHRVQSVVVSRRVAPANLPLAAVVWPGAFFAPSAWLLPATKERSLGAPSEKAEPIQSSPQPLRRCLRLPFDLRLAPPTHSTLSTRLDSGPVKERKKLLVFLSLRPPPTTNPPFSSPDPFLLPFLPYQQQQPPSSSSSPPPSPPTPTTPRDPSTPSATRRRRSPPNPPKQRRHFPHPRHSNPRCLIHPALSLSIISSTRRPRSTRRLALAEPLPTTSTAPSSSSFALRSDRRATTRRTMAPRSSRSAPCSPPGR